jgi:hypothetical protein
MGQIRGQLVSLGVRLTIREIGFGGFSSESPIQFELGARHLFQFTTADNREVLVTARVVYCRADGQFLWLPMFITGFAFVDDPERDTARDVGVLIDAMTEPPRSEGATESVVHAQDS